MDAFYLSTRLKTVNYDYYYVRNYLAIEIEFPPLVALLYYSKYGRKLYKEVAREPQKSRKAVWSLVSEGGREQDPNDVPCGKPRDKNFADILGEEKLI